MKQFEITLRWNPKHGALDIAPGLLTWRITSFVLPGVIRLQMKEGRYAWSLWEAEPIETPLDKIPRGWRSILGEPFALALAGQGVGVMYNRDRGTWQIGFQGMGRKPVTAQFCGLGPEQYQRLQAAIVKIGTLQGRIYEQINWLFWEGWNGWTPQPPETSVES